MNLHANAKLGLAGRRALVAAIEDGASLRCAAASFGVSPATAHRWWHRWLDSQELVDRSSRPLRQPRRLSPAEEDEILHAREQVRAGANLERLRWDAHQGFPRWQRGCGGRTVLASTRIDTRRSGGRRPW